MRAAFLPVSSNIPAAYPFLHGDHVAGIPLNRVTPDWIWGHALWTYGAAAVYAVAGTMLLLGKRTRVAATCLGLTVLVVELAVYVPIGIVDRASLDGGLNYVGDTLMYCGTLLLVAGAMRREVDGDASGGDGRAAVAVRRAAG